MHPSHPHRSLDPPSRQFSRRISLCTICTRASADHNTCAPPNKQLTLTYCPGLISSPCLSLPGAHPPPKASAPFWALYSCTLFSSSGLKCRMSPWTGHANASPSAVMMLASNHSTRMWDPYHKSCVPQPASSAPATYRSRAPSPGLFRSVA